MNRGSCSQKCARDRCENIGMIFYFGELTERAPSSNPNGVPKNQIGVRIQIAVRKPRQTIPLIVRHVSLWDTYSAGTSALNLYDCHLGIVCV